MCEDVGVLWLPLEGTVWLVFKLCTSLMHVYMYVRMYVCVCVCVCVYIYIYIYIL